MRNYPILHLSGLLGGWERVALAPAWKRASLTVYQIGVVGNTLTACNVLHEGVLRLRGALFRDCRVEAMERYPRVQ